MVQRVTDLLLERLLAGDLAAGERARLEALLAADPQAAARLAALRLENAAILAAHPPGQVAAEVARRQRGLGQAPGQGARAGAGSGGLAWAWLAAPALAGLLAVLVWRGTVPTTAESMGDLPPALRPPAGGEPSPPALQPVMPPATSAPEPAVPTGASDAGDRAKGLLPHLVVYRKRAGRTERLPPQARAAAGDLLQLGYVAAGQAHGVILSVDGRGAVTQHFPAPGSTATALAPHGQQALPQAYELDDAPDFERFFFVTSRAPLDPAPLLAAARRLAQPPSSARASRLALDPALDRDPAVGQVSFLLTKAKP